jgi:hypothetical protein
VQEYGEELARLEGKHGLLTADLVVKEAKKPRSVLHDAFEWDNGAAGEAWRLHQARNLINHIDLVVEHEGPEKPPRKLDLIVQRGFFNVRDGEDRGYASMATVKKTPAYRKQIMAEVAAELERLADKLAVFKALDKYAIVLRKAADALKAA